jgi:autotransporter-associated beta strand protein
MFLYLEKKFKFVFLLSFVFVRFTSMSWADTKDVYWSTWRGHDHNGSATAPSSNTLLKGLNAAGGSATALHADATFDDDVYDGDLIELGFFKLDDGSASNVAFKGVWTPITAKTTIGQNSMILTDLDGPTYTTYTNSAGEFDFQTTFSDGTLLGEPASSVVSTYLDSKNESSTPFFESDLGSSLSNNLTALDNASGSALLGIRFYDLNTAGDPSTPSADAAPSKANGTTRYNTIMDANWIWQARDSSTPINIMALHDANGNVNSSVQFEFDNTSAHSTNTSKIGTSDTRVENDDYVATVTYHDGSTALDLSNSGIGSTIVSGFDSTARIYGANDANILTINSASGNDGTEAFLHSGDIYNASSGTNASDLTIIKSGDGTQVLTGNINLADSTSSGESAYISIEGGTLEFDAASGKTQVIEYLKGSTGTLILDNTGRADQTLELGFAQSHSLADATFSGAVTLQGSNTKNTIKVSTGTAANDYTNEQVLSGVISGGEVLVKDGVGILTLEGNNANTGGVEINNGTLKVGNSGNDADLGSGTVTINKGKLEVTAGDSISNTINGESVSVGSDPTRKSMVGGDGTIAALTVGKGTDEVDVLSPGQGISSSLSETANLSNQQVTLGTSTAAEAMGNLTITSLTLNNGAIFDWEISDFNSGANQASFNDEFDVLNFTTLNFGSGAVIDVNIFSVQSNGTAGAVANIGTHSNNNGILFLNGGSHSDINWGAGNTALSNSGWSSASDYFSVEEEAFNYHNGNLMGDWNVWYNGSGDFYLRYTAAPEPSTYIMITGLLMLPGFRMFRKFFKKAKPENCSTDS